MCINIIDDVDCSHKAQILQLTTAARTTEVLEIYLNPSESWSFHIVSIPCKWEEFLFDFKFMLDTIIFKAPG